MMAILEKLEADMKNLLNDLSGTGLSSTASTDISVSGTTASE